MPRTPGRRRQPLPSVAATSLAISLAKLREASASPFHNRTAEMHRARSLSLATKARYIDASTLQRINALM
jgi:hypothetical protein